MKKKISSIYIKKIVSAALKEDGANHDITTRLLVDKDYAIEAKIIFKEDKAVVCGVDILKVVFNMLDKNIKIKFLRQDGDVVGNKDVLCILKGKARAILTAERVALNFLGILSGIATTTKEYVDAVKPYQVDIVDTRKTTPLLREFERFAVRVGGGKNHRFNLEDMVLVKDNHRCISSLKESLSETVLKMRKKTKLPIEVEVDSLMELMDVLPSNPDIILLDNMNIATLKEAVQLTHQRSPIKRPMLEASGGVTIKNVSLIAKTGVDRISIGALTHTRRSIDVSMEF